MPGPAPTPTEILKARGSWRADLRAGEVKFDAGVAAPPDFLQGEALSRWQEVVEQLDRAGILQQVDAPLIAAYCLTWGQLCEAVLFINSLGDGVALDELFKVRADCRATIELLNRLAQQLGFTPAARTKIAASAPAEKEGAVISRKRA